EAADVVVVVARNVDYARAVEALLQNRSQDLVMALRPIEVVAQALEIDDVADEIQHVATRATQKVEQQRRAARARSEVHVRYPHGSQRIHVHGAHRLEVPRSWRARKVYRFARTKRGRASQIGARDGTRLCASGQPSSAAQPQNRSAACVSPAT